MSVYTEYVESLILGYINSLLPYFQAYIDYLRQFNIESVTIRLVLALLCGGLIGVERGRKNRAAGFRTHMLVCLGAAITILIGQYETELLATPLWEGKSTVNADVARFGAQVINGVGFLGAGTILLTEKHEVKGLTTAAGLWASACMGLAIGAGFYECVLVVFFLIFLSIRLLPYLESLLVHHSQNINLYLEFEELDSIGHVLTVINRMDVRVFEIDISHGKERYAIGPNAVLSLKLPKRLRRERFFTELAKLDALVAIKEV